ncbi:hypothetical protein ACOMHN_047898 [Nucella lapillus]
MAKGKAEKRRLEVKAVLDDCLRFESWDSSDTEEDISRPKKTARRSDNEQGDHVSDSSQTVQYQNSCLSPEDSLKRNDSSPAEVRRVNGDSGEHNPLTESSGNKVCGDASNKQSQEGGDDGDEEYSTPTIIISAADDAEVREREEFISRADTEDGENEGNRDNDTTTPSSLGLGAPWTGSSSDAEFEQNRDQGHELSSDAHSTGDIFTQAMELNAEFPHINPSEIYELLENKENRATAVQAVREKLEARASTSGGRGVGVHNPPPPPPPPPPGLPKDDSMSNDPLVQNDPVYRDMRIIAQMFPEQEQTRLYALVEAHYYRPDRVQVVIEELLQGHSSQDRLQSLPQTPPPVPAPQLASVSRETAPRDPVGGAQALDETDDRLKEHLEHLRAVFPDCDPNFIFERLEAHKLSPDRVKVIAAEMFERRDYPRLKEVEERRGKEARKRHLQKMEFTLEEFVEKFPDPEETFGDTEKEMREGYRRHLDTQLQHDFPDFHSHYVQKVIDGFSFHLLPIVRQLEVTRETIFANGGRSKKLRSEPKEVALVYPEDPDERFFYELWYTLNEHKVNDHFLEREALRQVRLVEARANGQLLECPCCCEEECLSEDMRACVQGHLFCRNCVAHSARVAFGDGKTTFPCLSGYCEHQFPLSVLKESLPSAMFSKMLRKLQEEEVRQAGIADLVECPFCSFATIMPDPHDKVLHCLNPECLKDSCRLCREPEHMPLRCEEVERQSETAMRTFIERRVTEAMLRKCHRCGKHFIKEAGCNKMTCVCAATSCYVCKEPGIDYGHFTGSNCTEEDANTLHLREMEQAEREAREEYVRLHPEAADIALRHNPADHIRQAANQMENPMHDEDRDPVEEIFDDSSDESDRHGNSLRIREKQNRSLLKNKIFRKKPNCDAGFCSRQCQKPEADNISVLRTATY